MAYLQILFVKTNEIDTARFLRYTEFTKGGAWS